MSDAAAGAFPATRQSLVRDLGSADPQARAAAYDGLARSYWRPVYVYIRFRRRRRREDAQDLTQAFFARAFEREYLAAYDPSKARFRTFVRVCLDRFLANEDKAAFRLKHGAGIVVTPAEVSALDDDLAAHVPSDEPDPERWFYREWIRALFAGALERLRRRCEETGHQKAYTLFRRYDVDGEEGVTYAALAADAGLRVTDVTNELAWARRAFREIVLETLRGICASDDEFRAEARDLLGVDVP